MKFGEQLEKESVPGWSLHNIDYNSLKHHIKVNTTRDQATAIVIPGQPDTALRKFEGELFEELCRQHDRIDLFVMSKADEISRRLQHLSNQIRALLLRCATSTRDRISSKRQRRFAKYDQALLECRHDIQALERFVNAQVVAFRKILKKYRKWTGSAALGTRFRDTVLSHPKSFTKRDFTQLQAQYDELHATLRASSPVDVHGARTPAEVRSPARRGSEQQLSQATAVTVARQETLPAPGGYWNEYDYGSEAGDLERNDGGYVIYVDPNDRSSFPGMATLTSMFAVPVAKVKSWFSNRRPDPERGPLLPSHARRYGSISQGSYFTTPPGGSLTDTEAEDEPDTASRRGRRGSYGGYASSEDFPSGYEAHYASLPSINDQRMALYREQVLFYGMLGSFAASIVLLGVAAVLIMTGRHRLRVEVDAGVTLGVMASLGCACTALGMTFARRNPMGWLNRLIVWATFAAICVANGVLLVLVVGNTAL